MKRFAILSLFAVCSLGATCGITPPPIPIEPEHTELCPAACENLRRLGCPEGSPLEDGTTCEAFCKETQEQGHPLNPKCVSEINSCSELNECTTVTE